jgi:23S rRNA (adenine2030-N6)-methyltransferase
MLPPPEKRALVLIDPSFESKSEFADVLIGLGEIFRRLPSAVCAVWYPVTERARVDAFHRGLLELSPPPTYFAEIHIAGEASSLRMRGCGLLIFNPPWKVEAEIRPLLPVLVNLLKVEPGARAHEGWLVPEK